ncbi:adenylosuccinate synthetase [Longitalea luteola]|uniref:adenylosuccinate synthetase n=1 Tax=Longitalea luteola TaxID=2812563 RepID=UPI001A9788D4|nr:adenylosuccinate synthetase [Longitalea luteola]
MRNGKLIVLLSGEICSGKSKLCDNLEHHFGFKILKSKEALQQISIERNRTLKSGRIPLQKIGEQLDKDSGGAWLRNFFQSDILHLDRLVIDAVRIFEQIDAFRQAYGHRVIHIHLQASPEELKNRFLNRNEINDTKKNLLELYEKVKKDKTEKQVNSLEKKADLVVNTERNKPEDVLTRVAGFLKILPPIDNKLVDVLVGGQFGSEGKGQIAAYLAPNYDCLVRVGGPNAGHKVYAEPEPHVFHILPSGSVKNTKTKLIIGPGAVISKEVLLDEIKKFNIHEADRLLIDANATVITDSDKEYEKKHSKIGSTAQGVGKATAENILKRLRNLDKHKAKNCKELKQYIGSSHTELEKLFNSDKKILLEGTQGTHLSLHHGLYPYVTSRDTTAGGCLAEAGIAINRVRKIILVTRTYPIRVQSPSNGTSGHFYSDELTLEEIYKRSGVPLDELKKTEMTSTTKKQRRIAEFSWSLFRKSCELNSPTDIALTFSDYISHKNQEARRYDQLSPATTSFIDELERCAGVSVSLIATRFSYRSIIDRRNWI